MWLQGFGDTHDGDVFIGFACISAVIIIIGIVGLLLTCCGRTKTHYGASSADNYIIDGTFFLCYTVLVRGIAPEWDGDVYSLRVICKSYPVFLLLGLTLFIGGIFAKTWGIFYYNNWYSEKVPLEKEWFVHLIVWILAIIMSAYILVWLSVETFEMNLPVTVYRAHSDKLVGCVGRDMVPWQIASSVWHAFLLLLAVIGILPNCIVSGSKETFIHHLITMNTLFVVVTLICIEYLYTPNNSNHYTRRTNYYAINGTLILWACLFANVMIILGRCLEARSPHQTQNVLRGNNGATTTARM